MKFFTPAWCSGGLSDDEFDAVVPAYWAHIEALAPRLPETLRALATDVSLHDGLIRRFLVDRSLGRLTVELCCGDLQTGYFNLGLRYLGVDMNSLDISVLKELAEASGTEALYDEVDQDSDEVYVHRILFWIGREKSRDPYRDVEVRFRELDMQQTPCPDRGFDKIETRYEESDASTD